ncbi:O-antigen ligase family protein [Leifsonia sp. A12D58]|uniref:O-antigen ligase family protein n=1 Tax=Leifsonia sp. A12D58 TaxID=3397674 RepID=UPI0039E00F56
MTTRRSLAALEPLQHMFESPRFASSLTQVILVLAFSTHLIRSTMGWAGLIGALVTAVVLAILSMIARRESIEWHGLLPISILLFLGWSVLSLAWSNYPSSTAIGLGYQLAFAFLGIYIALVRDTFQVTRAVGDVLRVLLGLSLALEILSGLLLDIPIAFLDIRGNIAFLGPIEGIFGSRNTLALVALIAVVTFAIEWRAKSVRRSVAIASTVLAAICLLLSRSPVISVVAAAVGVAALALFWLRRTPAEKRWMLQIGLASAALVSAVVAWVSRTRILAALHAGSEFDVRYELWREMWQLIKLHPLEGWGWAGFWPKAASPYGWLDYTTKQAHSSGLNAFFDVYLQLGLVGLIIFLALVTLAFVRSWLLASDKRPLVYVWPALILVILLATSAAESTILVEFGWVLFIICAVKAAQGMSWRNALAKKPHPASRPDVDPSR